MSDIPIIFSGHMVRALLEGRKTMTRRIVSLRNCEFGSIPAGKLSKLFWQHAAWDKASVDCGFPDADGVHRHGYLHVPCHDNDNDEDHCDLCSERGWSTTSHRLRPNLQAGHRMWVRENVACGACAPGKPSYWSPTFWRREQGTAKNPSGLWYQADGLEPEKTITDRGRWVPSIHMPRWASRITLIVEGVKVERLADISDEDALAEGVVGFQSGATPMFGVPVEGGFAHPGMLPRESFWDLWREIHGPSSDIPNPFIVAITFRVIKANIDSEIARVAA